VKRLWVAVVAGALGAACSRGGAPSPSPAPGGAKAEPGAPPVIDRVTPLPSPVPDVVARVNGQPIYLRQIVGLAREALGKSEDREKEKPGALRQTMHQYIVRELLLQEAQARNLAADPRQLEETYNGLRVKYRDEKAWTDYLANQGHSPQSFKEELRVQQTVQALVSEESLKIDVTDEEAAAYLDANPNAFGLVDRVTVSHVLFRVPERALPQQKADALARAETTLSRIRKGEDFAKVARQMSQDAATRAQGGRLPELARGEGDPRFEAAAFALKPGEVSAAVETADGYEIIKLFDRRTVPVSFPQVRDRLKSWLVTQKRQASLQKLVNSLRAKARIETFI